MAGESILIVDDNAINVELLRALLEVDGYDIASAARAEEALAVIKTFRPRMILMDLQLPGMNGLELTRILKAGAATREIVIIAVTAYAMKGDEDQARQAGCDGYITKPINTKTLRAAIAAHLGRLK
jgi:two-component system, cell cycle response regulator DivK